MNKLRKALVLSLACLLLLTTFAAGALASIQAQPYTFNGQCLRTFTTSGSLTKPSAQKNGSSAPKTSLRKNSCSASRIRMLPAVLSRKKWPPAKKKKPTPKSADAPRY